MFASRVLVPYPNSLGMRLAEVFGEEMHRFRSLLKFWLPVTLLEDSGWSPIQTSIPSE